MEHCHALTIIASAAHVIGAAHTARASAPAGFIPPCIASTAHVIGTPYPAPGVGAGGPWVAAATKVIGATNIAWASYALNITVGIIV